LIVYNENNPYASRWLENLVAAGQIAPGAVDSRGIEELRAEDVRDATQFHTFAGIGVWSHALRLAGWPDHLPVWTGSCPCQPFSIAGNRKGTKDERHLWPEWRRLIEECRPPIIFGEQVASPDGRNWLDAVSADLEALDYAVGSADLCAAGVGAPHIRQRLFWVAYTENSDWRPGERGAQAAAGAHQVGGQRSAGSGADGVVADAVSAGRPQGGTGAGDRPATGSSSTGVLGDTSGARGGGNPGAVSGAQAQSGGEGFAAGGLPHEPIAASAVDPLGVAPGTRLAQRDGQCEDDGEEPTTPERASGATRGFWADAEWLSCTDGKTRPAEPGTFPLAYGAPARVGRLRAYGNAIVAQVAATFIRAAAESIP